MLSQRKIVYIYFILSRFIFTFPMKIPHLHGSNTSEPLQKVVPVGTIIFFLGKVYYSD